ncbi:expressed unknown protein [Seminavis robusta]|uniref:Uncharacterized protein n=1 Tax=Seminavis robusta TaxID=568900 RepID=A0A9N8DPL8_9STRA|nr:expressed unknown protein [Seminavis robusta]|eukprot:Sro200_g084740.1 n/a (345) ;mRNA; f:47152-48360
MHGEYALEEAAESGSRSDLTSDEDQRLSKGSPEKQDDDDEYEILSTRDGGDYDGDIDDDVNDEPEPTSTNPSRQPEENLSPNVATSGAIARNNGDIEWAISKAYQMQNFMREFDILDTLHDCLRHIPGFVKDRFLLSVDYNLHQGGYVMSSDGPKFDLSLFKTVEGFRGVSQRTYYILQVLSPDLAAVRAGITTLYECDGYQQALNNFCIRSFRKAGSGAFSIYPAKHVRIKFYNSPHFMETLLSMAKATFSHQVSSNMQFGCKFPGGRLDRIFNVPSAEAATARLAVKLEDLIRRRYENERLFSLAVDPPEGAQASTRERLMVTSTDLYEPQLSSQKQQLSPN